MAKVAVLTAFILAFIPAGASAKDTQFWNLTADTITSLQLSPPGKNEWGRNQADNDRDHTVDHDERLKITDTRRRRLRCQIRRQGRTNLRRPECSGQDRCDLHDRGEGS